VTLQSAQALSARVPWGCAWYARSIISRLGLLLGDDFKAGKLGDPKRGRYRDVRGVTTGAHDNAADVGMVVARVCGISTAIEKDFSPDAEIHGIALSDSLLQQRTSLWFSFAFALIDAEGAPARCAQQLSFPTQASERLFAVLPGLAAEAAAVAGADLLLRVKKDDAPARRIQFSDLLIEAENDLVSIGDELATQTIDIGFAGLALIGRSLLLGYCDDR
jgi:hypothetical protein